MEIYKKITIVVQLFVLVFLCIYGFMKSYPVVVTYSEPDGGYSLIDESGSEVSYVYTKGYGYARGVGRDSIRTFSSENYKNRRVGDTVYITLFSKIFSEK